MKTEGKYAPLESWLSKQKLESVPVTFEQIEKVIDAKLPKSASDHRAWWSNNPTNSVATYAWLNAGYKTAEVDMAGRKLVFRKVRGDAQLDASSRASDGFAEAPVSFAGKKRPTLEDVYGCMKGTITIAPGVDLTEPVAINFWAEFDAKWDEKLPR